MLNKRIASLASTTGWQLDARDFSLSFPPRLAAPTTRRAFFSHHVVIYTQKGRKPLIISRRHDYNTSPLLLFTSLTSIPTKETQAHSLMSRRDDSKLPLSVSSF